MEGSSNQLSDRFVALKLVKRQSESGIEKVSCFYPQCLRNRFDHIDRRGMLCVLDLANVAAINVRAMRKGFLAEPFGSASLLNV